MRGTYCYLPILRARWGAFQAIGELSPIARSRLTPLFDVPVPTPKNGKTLETYLAERAKGIHQSWGQERPVYVDIHDLPLDLRTSSGAQPIAYLLDVLRMNGSLAVPVTGTEADRGRDYLTAVNAIVARDRRGACLRLAEDDLVEPHLLQTGIAGVLELLKIEPSKLDLVLDIRYIGNRSPDSLQAILFEALQVIHRIGEFRNLAVAGSSVPQALGKNTLGKIHRERRIEYGLWTQLATALSDQMTIVPGDHGVLYAHYVPPASFVRVPPRIRYTTASDHIFYRAKSGEYAEICKQLVSSQDFAGESFSAGDHRISQCAKDAADPGTASGWVASDTNHHLEFASEQTWRFLREAGLSGRFALPEPQHFPWLQVELA